MQKNDFLFFVEIVICSLNIKDIENTIKKLDELGIKRIIFIHVITYKKRYNIKYSDSLPILEKVFKKFPDIKFQIYEVPPCILKKYPTLKKIRLNKCATNNELNIGEKICISKEQYKPVSCRRVLNICKGCDYLNNNQCSGAGRVYLDLYGDSEFKKFTRH